MEKTIILGTRGSKLAMIQTGEVKNLLEEKFSDLKVEIRVITTEGDQKADAPLSSFDGRGAFVRSLENALLNMEIDAAVHSLKDLPSNLPEGLALCASPVREDPRDVVVAKDGSKLKSLPKNSVIGTGSERRKIQLMHIRPDFKFKTIRGNIETRLAKLDREEYDAVIIAAAALKRLGMTSRISEYIDGSDYISAPCQGAIGIECRADDRNVASLMENIENRNVRFCIDAERLFISTLGMGCHTPVGAYAYHDSGGIVFQAFAARGDGKIMKKTFRAQKRTIPKKVRDLALQFRAELHLNGKKTE